ncbi:MAG: ankyrin repeat domain-containing protein [Bdellovibrionales bacterium]
MTALRMAFAISAVLIFSGCGIDQTSGSPPATTTDNPPPSTPPAEVKTPSTPPPAAQTETKPEAAESEQKPIAEESDEKADVFFPKWETLEPFKQRIQEKSFDSTDSPPEIPAGIHAQNSREKKYLKLAQAAHSEGERKFFLNLLHNDLPLYETDENGGAIFHWLADNDNAVLAKSMIGAGLTKGLDTFDRDHRLPLHLAQSEEMAKALWSEQALESVDNNGQTPLIRMADTNKPALLFIAGKVCQGHGLWSLFYTNPINVADKSGKTALHYAAINANVESIDRLLSCVEITLDVKDALQRTPLHYAPTGLRNAHTATYALLIKNQNFARSEKDRKRFLDAQDVNGDTAMHIAARCENPRVVSLLIYFGANRELRNLKGETPEKQSSFDCPDRPAIK